jgi:hypothetical protein
MQPYLPQQVLSMHCNAGVTVLRFLAMDSLLGEWILFENEFMQMWIAVILKIIFHLSKFMNKLIYMFACHFLHVAGAFVMTVEPPFAGCFLQPKLKSAGLMRNRREN